VREGGEGGDGGDLLDVSFLTGEGVERDPLDEKMHSGGEFP
jgi:hypothetical protein